MSENNIQSDANANFRDAAIVERLCWRPWPCSACSGGRTEIGYLVAGIGAGTILSEGQPEEIAVSQAEALLKWAASCPHSRAEEIFLPRIGEGSEHIVYLDLNDATVYKLTRPGIYGESYFLDANGKINQRNCPPLDYLHRLRLWKRLFAKGPIDLGITDRGQIASQFPFMTGETPSQEMVNEFLCSAELTPVRQEFWIWKRVGSDYEIWIGDTRNDNFVNTKDGIVPIDIRLWLVGGELADE